MAEDLTDVPVGLQGDLRRALAELLLGLAWTAAVAAATVSVLAWIDTWEGASVGLAAYLTSPLVTSAVVLWIASGRMRSGPPDRRS